MSNRTLKFTVRFMKEANSVEPYVSSAIEFFNNCHQEKFDHSVSFDEVRQCIDGLYSDGSLYEINFIIFCSNIKRDCYVSNFCSAIHKQWCNEANNNKYLHWLMPDSKNFIPTNYDNQYGNVKVSDFCFGTIPNMKNFVKNYKFSTRQWLSSIICSFSHLQRHFSLFISNLHSPECHLKGDMGHKIVVYYDTLIRIVANVDFSKEMAELFFHMEYPPFFYVNHSNPEISNSPKNDNFLPTRISKAKQMECGFNKFERTFSLGCICNKTLCTSKRVGKCLVLKISIADKFQARWIIEQLIYRCAKKTEICFTALETIKLVYNQREFKKFPLIAQYGTITDIDKFNCEYSWKSVHTRSLSVQHEIIIKNQGIKNYIFNLFEKLNIYAYKNPTAVANTLFFMADMIDKGTMFSFEIAFEKKFNYFCTFVALAPLPKGMCYARRVLITPSRIIFLRPYEHFDNRIIRKFGVEYMLRVSVQDDNFSKLTFAVQYNSNKDSIMKEIVGNVLMSGLIIGSRHYEVLASSSSQLREHGLWMYAQDSQNNTASSIREWMGDFTSIKNVAKYMARMGQCLSSTEESVQLSLNSRNEIFIDDIKSLDGKYTFSDGIGVISCSLANEVRAYLMQNKGFSIEENLCYQPMAFQIRYRGCKGMIAEDPRLPGRIIGIRLSMKKFECDNSNQLEIVKTSAPRKLFLNKHLITILEQMGIPKETFLDLQTDMMLNLLDSLMNENLAASVLACNLVSSFPFKSLCAAGISLTSEPFFRSLLLAFFKISAAKLRSSIRIAVPEGYARNMLGILDETGTLKYGQVFVQYSESTTLPNSPLKILTGPVIVTKNPSLHPGDVRKLFAVDVYQLHHVKDCIVFPAYGKRPHPDEMAGSDLDGDEYVVIWYEPLIYSRNNVPPMDYPVYEECCLEHKIQVKDMIDFFCHYIQNDCIGSFAHAHLVWADKLEKSLFSEKCMKIAERYPYVLDFAKHGTTKYLSKSERPDQYPDFMQKGLHGDSYHSRRALGLLYRSSRVLDACSNKINLIGQSTSFDSDLNYPGWEQYKESAEKHKQDYCNMITEILNKYSLNSEVEAFCGFVELEVCKKWRQESTNALKVVKSCIENIMFTFRNIFFKEVKDEIDMLGLDENNVKIKKFQRASAWYMSAYKKTSNQILSFPWILSDVLIEMKQLQRTISTPVNNFLLDIDSDINSCLSSGILIRKNNSEGICLCKSVLESLMYTWLSKSGLNIWSKEIGTVCQSCYKRIFNHFFLNSQVYCCTASQKSFCNCKDLCSPTKLILRFLKFFLRKLNGSIGKCEENCNGFISRNLQELSLQALAYLLITRNIKYLGLEFNTSNDAKNAIPEINNENMFEEEGDPIRIPVKTTTLKELIEQNRDEVISYLKENSGVKFLVLQPERDLHNNLFLIVNSVGKNWERWNLEAILLDPDFENKLKSSLN